MSCPFKKYSDIFGKPNIGFHSYRIFDIAIYDVLGTIIISGLISYWFNFNFFLILFILLLLGIILHRLFCVDTTINKLIFGKVN
jgi:uncharacterized membrane protein YcaP (DUF421 family)